MRDPAARALLRVCAAPDSDHREELAQLDPAAWQRLVAAAAEVRAAPLLARAARARLAANDSDAASIMLRALDQEARLDALRRSATLERIGERLAGAGISLIVLKGAALAGSCYPEPHLRPMVDLDLLIPGEDASRAQAVLLADSDFDVHPEMRDQVWSNPEHHPPIVDRATRTTVELHWRIGAAIGGGALQERLVRSAAAVGSGSLRYPALGANLLHLVANAAVKDGLISAMLVLADLHYGIAAGRIEPTMFFRELKELGLARAFTLLAAVAGSGGARWPEVFGGLLEPPPAHLVERASALLAIPRSAGQRQRIVQRAQRGGRGPLIVRLLARAARPDPIALASRHSQSPALAYLRWLLSRLGRTTSAMIERRRYRMRDSERVVAWIRSTPFSGEERTCEFS